MYERSKPMNASQQLGFIITNSTLASRLKYTNANTPSWMPSASCRSTLRSSSQIQADHRQMQIWSFIILIFILYFYIVKTRLQSCSFTLFVCVFKVYCPLKESSLSPSSPPFFSFCLPLFDFYYLLQLLLLLFL